jgi:DNA methyltransferase 1-associated protein 1
MKREVIKLVGGIPSIMPTGPSKPLGKHDKVTHWVWSKFNNPARSDNFKFSHWQRIEDIDKDYEYAQFNKKINLVEYNDEDYERLIRHLNPSWSKEETDYLWDLCRRFDLRFPVIHDRYDYQNRTIEELKDRYYSVARRLLEERKIFDHPIIKSGYNYEQEMKRRAYLERTIVKTKEDTQQENDLLKQAEEIENKLEKLQKTENVEKNLLEEEPKVNIDFEDFIKTNANKNDSFVYTRSQKLKFSLPVSEKLQKKVELFLKELSLPEKLTPTARVEDSYDTLRNNLVILSSLKKHLEKKEKEAQALQAKLGEMQNKVSTGQRVNPGLPTQNIININTAALGSEVSDLMSVSSTSKDKVKKNITLNKNRKVRI